MAIGLVDGWMKSKGHKANILNKDLIYLGCGSKYYLNKQFQIISMSNLHRISHRNLVVCKSILNKNN